MQFEFIAQFIKMLNNLSGLLDKAEAYSQTRKFDVAVLLNSRLAVDQFNFVRQIQMVCDVSKNYAARLAGQEVPRDDDSETTLPELRARIQKTVKYLQSFKAEDFQGWADRKITNPRREGKYISGFEFLMHAAIPNFYFHLTTAYSILRNNGVEIGKKDYLGEVNYRPL
jgi:uncharacterized protein